MIAEFDCKNEIEQLLQTNKITFEENKYKYIGAKKDDDFKIFTIENYKYKNIPIEKAFEYFLENYAKTHCKFETYRRYKSRINYNILPNLKIKFINELKSKDILELYSIFQAKNFPPKTIKNYLSLLNQVIRYFQNLV